MAEFQNPFGGTVPTAENKKILDEDFAASMANAAKTDNISGTLNTPISTTPPRSVTGNANVSNLAPVNTITSSLADSAYSDLEKSLSDLQAQSALDIQKRQAELDLQGEKEAEKITKDYESKRRTTEAAQGEETASSKALQFKLGRSATPYAEAEGQKLRAAQNQQLQDLEDQKNELIYKSRQAIQENKYKVAKELQEQANTKFNQQLAIKQEQRAQQAQAYDNLVKQQTLRKGNREEQDALSESIAPNIYQDLQSNPDLSYEEVVTQYAEQYGIDPIRLSGQLIKYKGEAEKEAILNAKNNLDMISSQVKILKDTRQAGTIDVPGIGEVKIEPSMLGDWAKLESKDGIYLYDQQTGELKNTGLKPQDLTASNIISALGMLGDPSLVSGYLKGQGITLPSTGEEINEQFSSWFAPFQDKITQDFNTPTSYGTHQAYDIAIPANTKISSPISGEVIDTKPSKVFGNNVVIQDDQGNKWRFAHLNSVDVQVGQTINLNQSLGLSGSTGESTGPHLHLEVKNSKGKLVDPMRIGGDSYAKKTAQDIMTPNSGITLDSIPQKQRQAVSNELNKLKEEAKNNGDIYGLIKSSAGGKPVSDSFTTSFEKALNTLSQVGTLQTELNKEATGPILGIVRSNNPYDTKAQKIKALLTSTVPNLARGTYGEVGVLTDNDIKLYSQTLPNLKSTSEVNNAILGVTIKSISRSLENKIKTQAGFGRDVSGIEDVYKDVKDYANSLLPKQMWDLEDLAAEKDISVKDLKDTLNTVNPKTKKKYTEAEIRAKLK